MKTLLIDNYDSFTYNLFQLIAEANGDEPIVVRNDAASWQELSTLAFDNVVISPGPGRPERSGDFGVCRDAIEQAEVPLLGVCLGHQGVGWLSGGRVENAPEVMHGRLSRVQHNSSPLFAGIPQEFEVVRYHSLCVADPLPDGLDALAWTEDGVLMALAHRTRPMFGVQFHPESICTSFGRRLLANFRDLSVEARRARSVMPASWSATTTAEAPPAAASMPARVKLKLDVRRLDGVYDAEQAFVALYADATHAFWLDSSRADERARFSFMGAADGPLASVVSYDVADQAVVVQSEQGEASYPGTIFDYLGEQQRRMRLVSDGLPFDFDCGFVGYLGYELKADCGGDVTYESAMPDAAFIMADRVIAFDHVEGCAYVLCLSDDEHEAAGRVWMDRVCAELERLPPRASDDEVLSMGLSESVAFSLSRTRQQYIADIARCKELLLQGETYEVCLTNKLHADVSPDPLPLYRRLRRVNPAPFSSFLRFGDAAVLCSSPERFLSIGRDRWAEAKPIKGTARRGDTQDEDVQLAETLRTDEKTRAENLMITDLLRNDLGIVCDIGTVHVPHLMEVESFQTVHQLVSTIRGRLRDDCTPAECVRACFPGGSMTGAPKKRTMEIINELEGEPRGVYSGAIGYIGLSGGTDFNIVIRTIVIDSDSTTIGVGGAIIMQSDAEDEYAEILLKGQALMRAISPDFRLQADT
ncbi:MAG TPA: aminodeoxychorismate synthase component I [Solirubrobacteraceae bacterium]|nr:aminodeoxychorismate synthase component I [Solirubrobacteraceae bacterium]